MRRNKQKGLDLLASEKGFSGSKANYYCIVSAFPQRGLIAYYVLDFCFVFIKENEGNKNFQR